MLHSLLSATASLHEQQNMQKAKIAIDWSNCFFWSHGFLDGLHIDSLIISSCHLSYWPNLLIIMLLCCLLPLFSWLMRPCCSHTAPRSPACLCCSLFLFFSASVTPWPCLSITHHSSLHVPPCCSPFPPPLATVFALPLFIYFSLFALMRLTGQKQTHTHSHTHTYLNRRQGQHLSGV